MAWRGSRDAVLRLCSCSQHRFECRSVEYNYVTLRCHLSDADRRSTGQYIQMVEAQGVDYFENLCLKGELRYRTVAPLSEGRKFWVKETLAHV